MMLDKVVFFCIMVFNHIEASQTERNFFVSETKSTWTEMGSVCLVGEPSFRFLSGTNVVGNVSISDIENNGVWVGYFEVMEYFYYIGCLTKDQVQNGGGVTASSFGGSPGQCYRQCGYGVFFGLMKSECVCFREDPTLLNVSSTDSNCNRSCNYQQGVTCGGPDSLSVYKFHSLAGVTSVEHDTKTNNNLFCIRLNPRNLTYSWTNCVEDLVIVCDFGGGSYVQPTKPATPHSWIDSAQKCFSVQASLLPVENNISLKEEINTGIWTKLIKSPVIYSFNSFDKDLFKARVIRYGFVTRQGNRYILRFTANISYRNIFCSQESEAFFRLETVVGISVAAGVLAAFVFSILIFKRRTQKKEPKTNTSGSCDIPAENCTNVSPTPPSQNLPSEHYDSINSDLKTKHQYELVTDGISEQLPNHNYYILEKINKTEDVREMTGSVSTLDPSHDDANKQLKEKTINEKADKTSSRSDLCIEGKGTEVNVYDKCYMDTRDAYDHVCISGNNITWKANKTYDTTM